MVLFGPATAGAAEEFTVHATLGSSFNQKTLTIAPGDTVEWVNDGGTHNVHFVDEQFVQPADPEPDSDWPPDVSRTFTEVGEYPYYCELHGDPGGTGMFGTIIVQVPDTEPPTSVITKPVHLRAYAPSRIQAFRGTASDAAGVVAEVEIALRKKLESGSCRWWDGDGFVRGRCGERRFVDAGGTETWSYSLSSALKSSQGTKIRNYTVFSRATDDALNVESLFEVGRNIARFEVRQVVD